MDIPEDLITPRLRIRPYRAGDRAFVLLMWGDSENGRYMSDPASENADEKYLKCIDGMADEPDGYYMIAELREDGTSVGTCCAFPEGDNYDIGYCVSKDHWKEGLGTEMLAGLIDWIKARGGRSVTGEVADLNKASAALLNKFGFYPDRKTRYKKWGEDTYFDAHYYRLDL